ncbi:MAG: hypothetical protein V3W41_22040 [Planctomycetota bacterium]
MSSESVTVPVPVSVATGAAAVVTNLREKAVQLSGTFSATITIEVSLDGTNFSALTGAVDLTAPAVVAIPFLAVSVRADTTVYASGTPAAAVIGDNPRTN